MRTTPRFLGFFALFLVCVPANFAQINPPPPDPHEMVTGEARLLSKLADRSMAIDFLGRARKNFDLHEASVPYTLKISFESNGPALNEGTGTMEELYEGHLHWRWMEQFQGSNVIRIGSPGRVYGNNPSEAVPLRVQLVRSVLLRPIVHNPAAFILRAANVERDGKAMLCLLLGYSPVPDSSPRGWVEREDCFDSATGLLQLWSEAPGIYALYDYTGATEFHGHILPRQISIFQEGRLAVQVRLERLEDAPDLDPSLFKPTPEMVDAGESFTLASPRRMGPMRVDPSDTPTSRSYQPVIVHAILDAQDGRVLDAETLQDSTDDLGRAALDIVKNTSFDPSGFQQEVFINLHFHLPAESPSGPPIFRSKVRWVLLSHRGKINQLGRPPHATH